VADGIVNLQVGLPKFTSPVDVYIGIFAPAVDPDNIYIVKFDNTLQTLSDQTLSDGLDPWKENTIGDTQESLFGEILTSELPPGTYDFCLCLIIDFFDSPGTAPIPLTYDGIFPWTADWIED
jgi:hypothetical protein